MNEPSLERWAERLTATARALPYPATPNLVPAVRQRLAESPARPAIRRWQVAFLALALILLGLLAVPAVRAGVARFIQIGVVRIFVAPSTPTPTAIPTGLSSTPAPTPGGPSLPTATPRPTATPIPSLLESLNGETTLAGAKAGAGFNVTLPTNPADLGSPDRVFLQDQGAPMVVLVWVDRAHPDQPRLALFEIAPGNIGMQKSEFAKGVPPQLQNTTVNGQPAAWTTGPYLLEVKDGRLDYARLIEGHVLVWVENDVTYRLELGINSKMDEAVKIAESLR